MRMSEYIQFVIDRGLDSNRTTMKHFYNLFLMATEKRVSNEPPTPANIASLMLEKTILKQQFIFLLNELGNHLYHNDKNQQDKVYNQLLGEKAQVDKDSITYGRVMIMQEINRKMMLQNAIQTMTEYEDEFRHLYLIYVQENYWAMKRQNRLLLNQREV